MANILYVDSDAARSDQALGLLRSRGHRVTAAPCGGRAMLHAEREKDYDAVILHLMTPSVDGVQLCRWLREHSPIPRALRVVFRTTDVRLHDEVERRLENWTPADVMLGPVDDAGQLVEALDDALAVCGSAAGAD